MRLPERSSNTHLVRRKPQISSHRMFRILLFVEFSLNMVCTPHNSSHRHVRKRESNFDSVSRSCSYFVPGSGKYFLRTWFSVLRKLKGERLSSDIHFNHCRSNDEHNNAVEVSPAPKYVRVLQYRPPSRSSCVWRQCRTRLKNKMSRITLRYSSWTSTVGSQNLREEEKQHPSIHPSINIILDLVLVVFCVVRRSFVRQQRRRRHPFFGTHSDQYCCSRSQAWGQVMRLWVDFVEKSTIDTHVRACTR